MVIKFDHITFACPMDYNYMNIIPQGYIIDYMEKNLENIPCKLPLLSNKQSVHDLIFLSKENSIPIEITKYKVCNNTHTKNIQLQSKHTGGGDFVEYYVKDVTKSQRFFESFGFKVTELYEQKIEMSMKPILDKAINIKLINAQDTTNNFLDDFGFVSLAFFVDSIHKEISKIKEKDYKITEINPLKVNGKNLNIGFVYGDNGEIIELIELKKEQINEYCRFITGNR